MMTLLRACLIPALLFLSVSSEAATPVWYKIEVLLVAYFDNQNSENRPTTINTRTPMAGSDSRHSQSSHLAAGYRYRQLQVNALRSLGLPIQPPADWVTPMGTLTAMDQLATARRINAQPGMRVVWHQAWMEAIEEQNGLIHHPLDIRFDTGTQWHVSGGFNLSTNRNLHIQTDLRVQQWSETAPVGVTANPLALRYPVAATVIRQNRRLHTAELHYIDHPMLAMLVYLTPISSNAGQQLSE